MLQAAAAAASGQQYFAATLFVVATPIGNLADLSLRAIHVLSLVDAVACEDTRHSAPLLRYLGLDKPLLALHEHNERQAAQAVLARLAQGQRVAYVSDAGTPAISDPGAILVAQVQQAGYRCVPIPGASSALAAVSVAGDEKGQDLIFKGFLPTRSNERQQALKAVMACADTQILFEAPHRIAALFDDLAELGGQRTITVCRELTKQFETVVTQAANQLPTWLKLDPHNAKGEFVLVVHALALPCASNNDAEHDFTLKTLMAELPLKQAVSLAATLTAAPRNALYARALQLKVSASHKTTS